MILRIAIPTLNRLQKLCNCIDSIIRSKRKYEIYLSIYFNSLDEIAIVSKKYKEYKWIDYTIIEEYKVPTFWNNILFDLKEDGLVYICDDVEFEPNTVELINTIYPVYFPNYDGILGINQNNIPSNAVLESAFGIIGKNYINNFSNKQIWCPDYYRFYCDKELYLFAKSISKFQFNPILGIKHYHAAFYKNLQDSTHNNVRTYLKQDQITFARRQEKNYLWGKDFNLINEI